MKVLRSKNVTTDATGQEQARATVVFAEGSLFFTHVMEWPEGLAGADLTAFVALGLEEVSPFALDSLAWGYYCDAASRTLFLYAACLPRISVAEQEQWPLAEQVYPAFLPLLAEREQGAAVAQGVRYELLLTAREVLLLEYPQGGRWPRRIDAAPLDALAEAPERDALLGAERLLVKASLARDAAAAHALLSAAGRRDSAENAGAGLVPGSSLSLWRLAGARQSRRGEIRFTLHHWDATAISDANDADATTGADDANASAEAETAIEQGALSARKHGAEAVRSATAVLQRHTVLTGEEALWQADLRDEGFIALARKRRIFDLRLWYGLCAAAAAAVLLLILLLVFAALGSVLKDRTATLAAQEPAVDRVRQDQDLLMRMRQFSADPFEPFSLIAALKSTKPDPIYFDSIELSGPDSVTVEGQGPTVDAVNAYVRALEQSSAYRPARQARMNLRDGASVFTLYLQYLGQPVPVVAQGQNTAGSAMAQRGSSAPRAGLRRAAAANSSEEQMQNAASTEANGLGDTIEGEWTDAVASEFLIDPGIITSLQEHSVAENETIAQIARGYGIPVSLILIANPGLEPLALETGQRLMIPVLTQPLPLPEN